MSVIVLSQLCCFILAIIDTVSSKPRYYPKDRRDLHVVRCLKLRMNIC